MFVSLNNNLLKNLHFLLCGPPINLNIFIFQFLILFIIFLRNLRSFCYYYLTSEVKIVMVLYIHDHNFMMGTWEEMEC